MTSVKLEEFTMHHVDPDVMSFMVAVLMSCITAFISIVKKVMKKRKPISKLWFSYEMGLCLIAFLFALEIYPFMSDLLPPFVTKPVFAAVCVHMSSRFILMLDDRASKAITG